MIPPGKTLIGSCSLCGGPVCVHEFWLSTQPDTPTCAKCGAVRANEHGPVIPMTPPTNQPQTPATTGTRPRELDGPDSWKFGELH